MLTKDEASLLSNQPDPLYPTSAFKPHGHHSRAASASAHVEPVYLVELDVFSQLRCLVSHIFSPNNDVQSLH